MFVPKPYYSVNQSGRYGAVKSADENVSLVAFTLRVLIFCSNGLVAVPRIHLRRANLVGQSIAGGRPTGSPLQSDFDEIYPLSLRLHSKRAGSCREAVGAAQAVFFLNCAQKLFTQVLPTV